MNGVQKETAPCVSGGSWTARETHLPDARDVGMPVCSRGVHGTDSYAVVVYVHVYVYVCICVCVCIYIYIYTHTYTLVVIDIQGALVTPR